MVALQEVALLSRDGDLVDNAGDLARQLGMDVRFAAVRTFEVVEEARPWAPGASATRCCRARGFDASQTVALPAAPMAAFVEPAGAGHRLAGIRYADAPASVHEPRCLLLAEVGGLTVGSAHFSHIGSGERLLQAEATAAAFADASPALLLGDLNAAIETPRARAPDGLDGWVRCAPRRPGTHLDGSGTRIDHVLARGASVTDCRVLREAGGLSDHYPVLAEIELPAGDRRNRRGAPGRLRHSTYASRPA